MFKDHHEWLEMSMELHYSTDKYDMLIDIMSMQLQH
jgi:hypothetical protein